VGGLLALVRLPMQIRVMEANFPGRAGWSTWSVVFIPPVVRCVNLSAVVMFVLCESHFCFLSQAARCSYVIVVEFLALVWRRLRSRAWHTLSIEQWSSGGFSTLLEGHLRE